MPDDKPIDPEQIDLNQLNVEQLRELRDAIAMRLAASGGAGYPLQPVPSFAYGEPGPTFLYGAPQASFAYGAPQASFAYGAPQASFAYGAPQASFAYGAPQASFAYGAPQAGFAYGAPRAGFAYGFPQAGFAYGVPQLNFTYSLPPEFLPHRDGELPLLLIRKWDSVLNTLNVGFRRVATGVVAGTVSLACAGLIGANAGVLPEAISLLAALFFDAWFVVEMLRSGGSSDES